MTRAFIIGNGKSLNKTPLHLLVGEDTWAVNKIRLIFDKTAWRPKYYVRTDDIYENADKGWSEDICEALQVCKMAYLGPYFYKYRDWAKGVEYGGRTAQVGPICGEHVYHVGMKGDSNIPYTWHPMEYCNFGGSLSVAIQLASRSKMYDVIYLVGCDLDYNDDDVCHFDPNYNNGAVTPFSAEQLKKDKIRAHEIAFRSSKVPILNATIGGELEVYPRVDLMELLNG